MKNTKIKIAILSASAMQAAILGLSSMLSETAKAFPDASTSAIQMILTLPSLLAVVFALISGVLATIMRKKNIVIISLLLNLAGGLFALVFHSSLIEVYISSILIGIGMGGLSTNTSALITEYFPEEQGAFMGYQSAVVSIGGAVFALICGLLAKVGWFYSYFSFLLMVPVIILVVLFLPKGDVVVKQPIKKSGKILNFTLVYLSMTSLVYGIFMTAFNTNIAMFLDASSLGDSRVAGIVNFVYMFVGIFAGLLVGRILKKIGRLIQPLAVGLTMLGMLSIYLSTNLALVYVGSALIGFGFALRAPTGIVFAAQSVPPRSSAIGIAVFLACGSIGQFISPVVVNSISAQFTSDIKTKFLVCSIMLAVLLIAFLIKNPVQEEKTDEITG